MRTNGNGKQKNVRLLYHYKHLVVFGMATNSVVCCGLLNALALKCPPLIGKRKSYSVI